jgi:GAF domain-containing protein/HAMP domain-containing protein/anti-sigma regulatory factor (Ser/Thr protein kinase)
MDVIASGKDYSQEPSFTEAKKQRVWFSPVYFRKESEPYLTLAMAQAGSNAGVTIAEVNLKLIWDVISGMKVGQGGYAFVIDRNGRLIAHPDISLVLRDSDLAGLMQVAAARAEAQADQAAPPAMVAKSVGGETVLTAHAGIVPLGWTVFVELPLREAMAPLYQSAVRNAALLAVAIGLAALAALFLARRMTVPIRLLQAGAARIGAGELDRRIDIHTGDELEELAGEFNRMAGDLQKSYAELEQKVEDRTAELKEALDQQTATAELLQVINSSPGDLAPVFDAILEKAHSLCGAAQGVLATYDGEHFRAVATRGQTPEFAQKLRRPFRPAAGGPQQRLLNGERLVHVPDVTVFADADPIGRAAVEGGIRTLLMIPLRKDDALLGYIAANRSEVRLFTDKQIALLQNFAAQAEIAMENARLITETREALEQQTATAEVLQVINSSPGDLAPVFDAMLEKAVRLCEATFGGLTRVDGNRFHAVAMHNVPSAFAEAMRQARPILPGHAHYRLLNGEDVVQAEDVTAEDIYRSGDASRHALADLGGARTVLWAALRKDNMLLGAFVIYRQEVRPFSDKQIALLQNFAAQAVIAMENARLINETREALEQQTATAEVLQVINSSPGNLVPVFDAMLDKAMQLCGAKFGILWKFDGEAFHATALRGVPPALVEFVRRPMKPAPGGAFSELIGGKAVSQTSDVANSELYRSGASPLRRAFVDLGGTQTVLFVALRKDGALLGALTIYREENKQFTDKQVALVANFAAQAVIAMENARLITETREALEQQTATAEVLQVINSSPGDLAPVFDAMLEKALRLCGAAFGQLATYDGERFHRVAVSGEPRLVEHVRLRGPFQPRPDGMLGRIVHGEDVVYIEDVLQSEEYRANPHMRELVDIGGHRTSLSVALRKEGTLFGTIGIWWKDVRPFTDKQIALLQNFAAQAVIAMENARLITELRQRTRDLQQSLEYQTATSDVLKVISRSTFDLQPVLDTLVNTAARLCNADLGHLTLRDGQVYRVAASFAFSDEWNRFIRQQSWTPSRSSVVGRSLLEARAVHIADITADPEYAVPEAVTIGNIRTLAGVPLLRENVPIGVFAFGRRRVEPFTERQIALVTTFADQAVIAIENARLFDELRERTAELGRSVEELKMLSEVAQAVSSTLDLRAVLSTVLTRSVGLTGADAGAIFRYNRAGREFRLVEEVGWDDTLAHAVGDLRIAEAETAMGEAVARRAPMQIADLAGRPSAPLRDASLAVGFRSVLIVPLVGADRILGALVLQRRTTGEFPPETVQLMQTLAGQSVLAIQNARLFREIADKSEQLALASQHKSQFLANMSHELRTPLNAILGYAELLVDGIYGALPERPKGVLERIQNNGKHLLALINDVLDLAKIEAGQLNLTLEDYSLPEVVKSVVTATEPLANSKGLKFTAAVAENLPTAHGDARRVSQVLLNLVGNAIKFTDAGEVEICAAAERGQFVLTVRDTGPGIAEADQERIFGEFQQIDTSNTRKQGGTGLGLAISKRMVEMQGGTISVDSVLGQGSTFRVVLPIHVDEVLEEAA